MAVASPIPLEAPVTSTDRPVMSSHVRRFEGALANPRLVPMSETTGDSRVDAALEQLSPGVATLARSGFEALTWGQGLEIITLHGLAEFLWYQLPAKFLTDLDHKRGIAAALGELFAQLELPRYAALCTDPVTDRILVAYEEGGSAATRKIYRTAIEATGVEPPAVPDLFEWGSIMGGEEYAAYREVSVALEAALDAGELKPGVAGWRKMAQQITARVLQSHHDDVTGSTWLQWVHTERLQHWAESGGAARQRMASVVADSLVQPEPVPADAADCLAPLQWLIDHAAVGAPLTRDHYLAWALVVEAYERFGWFTMGKPPSSEAHTFELRVLRKLAQDMRLIRRSGKKLVLSRTGESVRAGGTEALWNATVGCLLGFDDANAEVAASEISVMLMLAGERLGWREMNAKVAEVMAEGHWHDRDSGQPIDEDAVGSLVNHVNHMLELFSFSSGQSWSEPRVLTDAGRAAARAALRARALRPRTSVYS